MSSRVKHLGARKKLGYDVAVKMISLSLVAVVVASPVSGTLRFSCTHFIGRIYQITQSPPRSSGRLCFDVTSFGYQTFNVTIWLSNTTNRRHCKRLLALLIHCHAKWRHTSAKNYQHSREGPVKCQGRFCFWYQRDCSR